MTIHAVLHAASRRECNYHKKKKQFKETYKNIFNKRNAALTEELLKIHLSQRLQSLTKTLI